MNYSYILYTQEDENDKPIHSSSFIVYRYLRMKRKNSLFFILCMMVAATLPAQNGFEPLASVDDFKKKLSEEFASLKSLESHFTQTKYMDMLAEKMVSAGTFYFKKDNKICLDYTSPVKYSVVINGKKVKLASGGKSNVYDLGKNKAMSQTSVLISTCITGNINELTAENQLIFKENDAQYWIRVQPKGTDRSLIKTIDIFIDRTDFSVQQIKLTESSNDYTEYAFTNKKKNVTIADAKFTIK
jgi:outer membrane lipoprotein-sorting protein